MPEPHSCPDCTAVETERIVITRRYRPDAPTAASRTVVEVQASTMPIVDFLGLLEHAKSFYSPDWADEE